MATETELKVRVDRFDELLDRLGALGAAHVADMREINAFYDAPDASLRRSDRGLRLRRVETTDGRAWSEITYKGPRTAGSMKSRTEIELTISDHDGMAAMLEALGYQRVLRFEKRRSRHRLDGCHIELDELPRLGRFVEIEGPSEEIIAAARMKLGLDDHPPEPRGYATLLHEHAEANGLDATFIRFAEPAATDQRSS